MSSESFGMQVVGLAGAPNDAQADQYQSLANTGRVAGGDIVKGYDTAKFNQAIQEGDKFLLQMAEELNVPPEVRDQVKVFTGSPEATKAGANYLMKWHQQNTKKDQFEYGMGLVSDFDDKFKKYSEEKLMGLDSAATKEERDALAQALRQEREQGLLGLRNQTQTEDELLGLERMLGQSKDNSGDSYKMAKLQLERDRLDYLKESKGRSLDLQEENKDIGKSKFDIGQQNKAFVALKLGSPTSIYEQEANTRSLIKILSDNIIPGNSEVPGFLPFTSANALPQPIKRITQDLGITDEEFNRKSQQVRAGIGRYLDGYKKLISGTAVSDQEYNKLVENLSAGKTNTVGEFLDSFISMVEKDQRAMQEKWSSANKAYQRLDGSGALSELKDPSSDMKALLVELRKIRQIADSQKDADFNGEDFIKKQGIKKVTDAERKENERLVQEYLKQGNQNESGGKTLGDLGFESVKIGGDDSFTPFELTIE